MADIPKIRFKGFTEPWEQRKLGDICERVTRKNKNNQSDLPLTISSQYGLIDQRNFFNKVVAAKDMSNYYLLQNGEYAYNKSYSNGYDYGSIKRLNAYEQGCLSTLYICFSLEALDVDSDYLECFFDTLQWYGDVSMICAEGARNHGLLNVDTKAFFTDVRINLPISIKEQRLIAKYLNNLDHLITLHQRKCDDTKELKKYMLQKMFPKNGEKFPEIRFKGFTEAWEQRKFGELVDVYDGVHQTPDYQDSGIMFLSVENISTLKSNKYISTEAFERDYKVYPEKGDILMTRIGDIGTTNVVESTDKMAFYVSLALLKLKDIDSYFLSNAMKNEPFQKGLRQRSLLTAIPQKINKEEIGKTDIFITKNPVEQKKIGEYFSTLDHLITLHQRKCDTLKELKKYMLQNMFPKKG